MRGLSGSLWRHARVRGSGVRWFVVEKGELLCVSVHAHMLRQQRGLKGLTVSCLRFFTGIQRMQDMLFGVGGVILQQQKYGDGEEMHVCLLAVSCWKGGHWPCATRHPTPCFLNRGSVG